MKIVQIAVSGYQSENADVAENIYALCENGRVAMLDVTDNLEGQWVALPEVDKKIFDGEDIKIGG